MVLVRRRRAEPPKMRDPKVALDILSGGTGTIDPTVKLCICCVHHQMASCSKLGHEEPGLCNSYVFDQANPKLVEHRVLMYLQARVILQQPQA